MVIDVHVILITMEDKIANNVAGMRQNSRETYDTYTDLYLQIEMSQIKPIFNA